MTEHERVCLICDNQHTAGLLILLTASNCFGTEYTVGASLVCATSVVVFSHRFHLESKTDLACGMASSRVRMERADSTLASL